MLNKYKKTICIDIDNTICKTTKNFYTESKPIKKNVEFVNYLYANKYYIIFFTSRGMNKYKKNRKIIYKKHYDFTKNQLEKWGLNFHELILCKPSFDIFIDDKNLFHKKSWAKHLKKKLNI
jgi:hypothetical protein